MSHNTKTSESTQKILEVLECTDAGGAQGLHFVARLAAAESGAEPASPAELRALFDALSLDDRKSIFSAVLTSTAFREAFTSQLGEDVDLKAAEWREIHEHSQAVTLSNILIGSIGSVLNEVSLAEWPAVLSYAITELYRIHSREPEAQLLELSLALTEAIPAVKQRVEEREARLDAADAALTHLDRADRRAVRDGYGI